MKKTDIHDDVFREEDNIEPNQYPMLRIKSPAEYDITKNKPQSCLTIGNIEVYCIKRFNAFERKMIKIFFGFNVENLKEKEKKNAK